MHGARLLTRPGIRQYVMVPLAINVAVFAAAAWALFGSLDGILGQYLAGWPEWLYWIALVVTAALMAVVMFFSFSLVANIIASPFNGLLAEAVERQLRGDLTPMSFNMKAFMADLVRVLKAELRKLVYIALRALPLIVISVIPGLNLAAPVLWFAFGAWMLCLEYLDCPLGNHHEVFPAVIDHMRVHRRAALGFGSLMTVVTMIPIINFLAMPMGVAGATSFYCSHLAESDSSHPGGTDIATPALPG